MRKILLGLIGLLFAVPAVATDSGSISSVTVAGLVAQNGTPTPNAPVDIVSNNGVLKVSKNLFNKIDDTQYIGAYVDSSTGKLTTYSYGYVFVVPCKPNTTYTLSGMTGNSTWGSFTSNALNTIATAKIVGNGTLTTGANDQYLIGIAYTTNTNPIDYRDTLQIEEGSTATAYRPYGQIYTDGEIETIADSANHTATVATLLGVGDYRDTQNINTGAIARNVGVKVLDGTEDWTYTSSRFRLEISDYLVGSSIMATIISHYKLPAINTGSIANGEARFGKYSPADTVSNNNIFVIHDDNYTSLDTFKAWLAEQYAAGTPVMIVYPLATETTESVAGQTMTTAPVNNRTGGVAGMTITTLLSSGASVVTTIAANAIKIATTAYNAARFNPVVTELNDTIATIRSVVTNTINQTKAIADLQATKQTRPDENCPAGKKCLLVEDNDGQPHWYEIIESASLLPDGFTELEYLKSNTGTYIDTGYKANLNTKMVVDFAVGHEQPTGNTYILGENSNGDNNKCFYMATKAGSLLYAQFDTISRQIVTDPSYVPNQKYRTTLSKDGWYVDNVLGATYNGATAFTTDNTLSLFKASRTAAQSGIIIYQATIYENDTLVRDFIPARRESDGVLGMYDLADNNPATAFHTNAGTGTFDAGPEI